MNAPWTSWDNQLGPVRLESVIQLLRSKRKGPMKTSEIAYHTNATFGAAVCVANNDPPPHAFIIILDVR